MGNKSILIADDEKDILDLLEYALKKEDYQVFRAMDGEETIEVAEKHVPNIVLLDIMMPKMDGIEVCRQLRDNPLFENTYILILTARGEEYSEVAGFDAGADDYITKPVKIRSLMRRLHALQRRRQLPDSDLLNVPPLRIDRSKYLLYIDELEIKLPRKEFELLYLLTSNSGKVVTRENILQTIWGKDVVVVDRTIDVHIRRIRQKIGEKYIQTVKGVGYKFLPESELPST